MRVDLAVDAAAFREEVNSKYREVVANPHGTFHFHTGRPLTEGERVVDVGSGAGFDCFVAAHRVGGSGREVGVDMTDQRLSKARATAAAIGVEHVEFRQGLGENLPVEDGWADVVMSNGAIDLCADKRAVFSKIFSVLRPGGHLEFADIAIGPPVDTFQGASGEKNARRFEVSGHPFLARKP